MIVPFNLRRQQNMSASHLDINKSKNDATSSVFAKSKEFLISIVRARAAWC